MATTLSRPKRLRRSERPLAGPVETPLRRRVTGFSMVIPMTVVVLVFLGWPTIWTFVLSFTNQTVTGPTATHYQYIGFANFEQLFSSGSGLVASIGHTLYYLVVSAYFGQVVLGFAMAYLMARCNYAVRAVVGAIVIVAWLVPEIVTAWMWFVLLGNGGTMSQAFHALGLGYQNWLTTHPMLSVSLANSWRGVAFSYLIFAAALDGVPDDLVDAAKVDGAGEWRRLTRVVVPLLATTILVDLVVVTLGTLNDFSLIYAMTGGGPGTASNVLSVFMYRQAFETYQLAYGTAIAVVLLVIGAVFAVIYIRILRRAGTLNAAR